MPNLQKGPCGGSTQGLFPQEEHGGEGEEDSSEDSSESKEEKAGVKKSKLVRRFLGVRARVEGPIQAIQVEDKAGKTQTADTELRKFRVGGGNIGGIF